MFNKVCQQKYLRHRNTEKKGFDFESFAKQAAEDLKAGKPMVGKDGVFSPLLKQIIEASLEG